MILSQTKAVVEYKGEVFLVVVPDEILSLVLRVDLYLGVIGFAEPDVGLSPSVRQPSRDSEKFSVT